MTYDLFAAHEPSPNSSAEPYATMRKLNLPYKSDLNNPQEDKQKVLLAIEDGGGLYISQNIPLPNGAKDPGEGPYWLHRTRLSGHSWVEDQPGAHFEITWVFNKFGHMLTCEAVKEQ